jgi:hypothetical protein
MSLDPTRTILFTVKIVPCAKKTLVVISYRSKVEIEPNGAYGSMSSNGTWTGMIGMLINSDIEVAVGDISMSTKRITVVDFTVPIFETT